MPSSKDLRERATQRVADVVNATIISRNDDGTYDCEDTRTQHRFRAAKANRNDEFSAGTRVVVAPTGASRRTIGAGAVIVSRAPQEQRGLRGEARIASLAFGGHVVTGIAPSPLRIPIGFTEPRELTILGFGLSAAPTYGSAEISDSVAPVITSTEITCELVASAVCPEGDFSVTIHGRTFGNALQTYLVGDHVYVTGYCQYDLGGGNGAGVVCVVGIRTSDWTVDRMLLGSTGVNVFPSPTSSNAILSGEAITFPIVNDEAGDNGRFVTISIDTDSNGWDETATLAGVAIAAGGVALVGALIAFVSSLDDTLYTVAPDGTLLTAVADLSAYGAGGVTWDGTYYWVTRGSSGGLLRVTTGGTVAAVAGMAESWVAGHSGGFAYCADLNTLRKITAATAVEASNVSLGVNTVAYSMLETGGFLYLYITIGFSFPVSIRKIDLATFTTSATLSLGSVVKPAYPNSGVLQLSADGLSLYALVADAGSGDELIKEISLASFTVTNTVDLASLVDLPQWEAFSIITA